LVPGWRRAAVVALLVGLWIVGIPAAASGQTVDVEAVGGRIFVSPIAEDRFTTFRELTVYNVPPGTQVELGCTAPLRGSCPFSALEPFPLTRDFAYFGPLLKDRRFGVGARLAVVLRRPEGHTKVNTYRMRSGRVPVHERQCFVPGAEVSPCTITCVGSPPPGSPCERGR